MGEFFVGVMLGIGKEFVRVLVKRGVYVIFVVWNVKVGEVVCIEIFKEILIVCLDVMYLDLNLLILVCEFVVNFRV